MLEIILITIVLLVLVLPLAVHAVERNLELFLFIMGVLAVSFSHLWGPEPVWSGHLVGEALREPVMITAAVAIVGMLVYYFKESITKAVVAAEHAAGSKLFAFLLITVLGTLSSVLTAIMAAIILVEVVSALKLETRYETRLVILGCFSIGLGAALTPIGEPLSTIVVAKLRGESYNADFFFLLRTLGWFILPGILAVGVMGYVIEPTVQETEGGDSLAETEPETRRDIFVCAAKVYVFIMALILLGTGFKPIIDRYIIRLPSAALYWINSISAVMDNATLAAAEISPKMSLPQLKYILMGLLIAGGMLIPGNIPNIISAGRLRITSKQWARVGLPVGVIFMIAYFGIFLLLS